MCKKKDILYLIVDHFIFDSNVFVCLCFSLISTQLPVLLSVCLVSLSVFLLLFFYLLISHLVVNKKNQSTQKKKKKKKKKKKLINKTYPSMQRVKDIPSRTYVGSCMPWIMFPKRILHECSCFIEFIERVVEKI